jgi:predicted ArsR family transcriptional regulator
MPKRYHLNRPDLAQAVAEELRTCKDVKSQQRLLAARLAASGQMTAAQIAEQLGVSRRRFFDWMNALKAGGLAGLLATGTAFCYRSAAQGRLFFSLALSKLVV